MNKIKQIMLGFGVFVAWFIVYGLVDFVIYHIKNIFLSNNGITNTIINLVALSIEVGIMFFPTLIALVAFKTELSKVIFTMFYVGSAIIYIAVCIIGGSIPYNIIAVYVVTAIPVFLNLKEGDDES